MYCHCKLIILSAPGGELLMVRIMPEDDRTVRLEYTSQYTGTLALSASRDWGNFKGLASA